jgi:D-alanyl-lipoteichoic acid acyltransferase DltB (MBOAT superfamily)
MNIIGLIVAIALTLLLGLAVRRGNFSYLLLTASIAIIFYFQNPTQAGAYALFVPLLTVGIAVFGWLITTSTVINRAANWIAIGLIVIVPCALYGTAVLWGDENPLLDVALPQASTFLLGLIALAGAVSAIGLFLRWKRSLLWAGVILILGIFVILKAPGLNVSVFRSILNLESIAEPLPWLGFSYVAFRVLHTIRDRQMGKTFDAALAEYVSYAIFFPSFVAGPIDRLERFLGDLRSPLPLNSEAWLFAGTRIFGGLFKKFVIANGLAMISLTPKIAAGTTSPAWMWLFVYAYALQIYFDFSGYTDIAIGMARLMGIRLPENFNAPYLKPNITQFWNNWHMTLTQWFRAYFFNPVSRALRSSKINLPQGLIILLTQIVTMSLIGLWHGITINFWLWGAWHGIGLFIHNRWSDAARPRVEAWASTPARAMIVNGAGVALTFHFVAAGWVFFALPDLDQSLRVLSVLFGIS